jgi:hypothetical protein
VIEDKRAGAIPGGEIKASILTARFNNLRNPRQTRSALFAETLAATETEKHLLSDKGNKMDGMSHNNKTNHNSTC